MTTNQRYSKTTYLVMCGLFAAVIAVCSFISIPLPFTPVPINLGTLGVFLSAGVLGNKYGTLSTAVYILIGIAGLPVFAGFQAGIGIIAGPTGGYILGYLTASWITGTVSNTGGLRLCITGMTLGLISCYALGTLWFMVLMGTELWPSLMVCVIPFIPADIVKILAGSALVNKLRPLIFN